MCWPSLLLWELRISDQKMATEHHVTHQSLFYHMQQVQQSTFLGWVPHQLYQKLSSTHSRKLIHYSSLLNCHSSRHLVGWSPPREQGLLIMRLLTAGYRIFHLPLPPGWEVSNSCVSHPTTSCDDNSMIIFQLHNGFQFPICCPCAFLQGDFSWAVVPKTLLDA